jgi:hypothetical protein
MPAECQHPFDVSPSSESGGGPDAELSRIEGRRDGVRVVLAAVRMTAPLMLSTTLWAIVGWAIWRAADRPPSAILRQVRSQASSRADRVSSRGVCRRSGQCAAGNRNRRAARRPRLRNGAIGRRGHAHAGAHQRHAAIVVGAAQQEAGPHPRCVKKRLVSASSSQDRRAIMVSLASSAGSSVARPARRWLAGSIMR